MKKTYRVTVEYRGCVTVEVSAKDEDEAEKEAMEESDGNIIANLSVYDVQVREE